MAGLVAISDLQSKLTSLLAFWLYLIYYRNSNSATVFAYIYISVYVYVYSPLLACYLRTAR